MSLRGAQFISTIIILSLCSYIDQWTVQNTLYAKHAASPIGFLIFVPVFSIVSAAYLIFGPSYLTRSIYRFVPLVLTSLNSLFYISGFIALSVYLSNLNYCRGSVCDSAKAACFFAVFSYLLWLAEAVLMGLAMLRGQRGMPLPLKDDYEDHDENEDQEDQEEDDADNYPRKHISTGEKLSDVKL